MPYSKTNAAIIARRQRIAAINTFAIREGWFIANEGAEIQRDDSDDIGRGFVLDSDESAVWYVQRLAKDGSALHLEALELVKP